MKIIKKLSGVFTYRHDHLIADIFVVNTNDDKKRLVVLRHDTPDHIQITGDKHPFVLGLDNKLRGWEHINDIQPLPSSLEIYRKAEQLEVLEQLQAANWVTLGLPVVKSQPSGVCGTKGTATQVGNLTFPPGYTIHDVAKKNGAIGTIRSCKKTGVVIPPNLVGKVDPTKYGLGGGHVNVQEMFNKIQNETDEYKQSLQGSGLTPAQIESLGEQYLKQLMKKLKLTGGRRSTASLF